jgi:hypothetical protein
MDWKAVVKGLLVLLVSCVPFVGHLFNLQADSQVTEAIIAPPITDNEHKEEHTPDEQATEAIIEPQITNAPVRYLVVSDMPIGFEHR